MRNAILMVLMMGAVGCRETPKSVNAQEQAKVAVAPRSLAQKVIERVIFTHRGIHPAVAGWYYDLHPRAFQCKSDPYACRECPVGAKDRVVDVPNTDKAYDVPTQVNAWFACGDINMLVPAAGSSADFDTFLCERRPHDGSIRIDGQLIHCSGETGTTTQLGTIQPGESKTITVEVDPQ